MRRFEHGGDIYTHPGVLDFSANLNPLGIPARVRAVLQESVDAYAAYPDPHCRTLVHAIAAAEGVDERFVQATSGATDAITRLCRALRPRRALLAAPCYSGYEQALEQMDAEVVWHDLRREDGFALTEMVLDRIDESVDVVFLANPNNPTGRCIPRELLLACLERARAADVLVVLDECFVDLTEHTGSADLVAHHQNLVIVKAHTKSYALAGLRVGYAFSSNTDLLMAMAAVAQPWAVSVPAQLAGAACLEEQDYLSRSRAVVARERTRMKDALESLGLMVIPGEANYLLFEGPKGLADELLVQRILVRRCDNFRGLGAQWYRVAVRTAAENEQLMTALREVCA